ncbi:hypothetical protein IPM19_02290 [bacterium]|nr:MAG: hypothetical protein IPM19_02290 [bacterium]
MSALQKEQIYVELRKYHLDELPDSFANPKLNELLAEYRLLEDQSISMLLGLVNGKSEIADFSNDYENFAAKIEMLNDVEDKNDKQHFHSKLESLKYIISMAQAASFTIRPVRKIKQSSRAVVTKINKK